jgi:hypothetical protein
MSDARRSEVGIELLPANPARRRPRTRAQRHAAVRSAPTCDRDYANVKRREWQAAHEQITQLEMDHYLQLYQSEMGSP